MGSYNIHTKNAVATFDTKSEYRHLLMRTRNCDDNC